jgi:sugar phosphate isomerase/epimerase
MMAGASGALVGTGLLARLCGAAETAKKAGWRIGMCDWSMGRTDVTAMQLARRIGLDGVEVSIGSEKNNLHLRRPEIQRKYLDAAKKHGVRIPSIAMGVLNHIPLMSEPKAALWVADTIEVTKRMGARTILLAFFGKGRLREENKEDMRRVTEVLKELAPRAEKAGVVLGLETYLRAEALLKILDEVKSKALQVYYDVYNANHEHFDYVKEIRMLGRKNICSVHFKEGPNHLGESDQVDWPATASVLKEIGYDGWLVLETSNPGDVVADTQRNVAYLRRVFGSHAAKGSES